MSDENLPLEMHVITDLETLKVLSDPFRMRILETMGKEPITVKTIANNLGLSPKKLYYHINLLEEHDLIVMVDTQIVSGIIEKWYQIKAISYTVSKDLLRLEPDDETGKSGLEAFLDAVFESTKEEIKQAYQQGLVTPPEEREHLENRSTMYLRRSMLTLAPSQRDEFEKRLNDLVEEYDNCEMEGDEEVRHFGLTIASYPLADLPNDDEEDND